MGFGASNSGFLERRGWHSVNTAVYLLHYSSKCCAPCCRTRLNKWVLLERSTDKSPHFYSSLTVCRSQADAELCPTVVWPPENDIQSYTASVIHVELATQASKQRKLRNMNKRQLQNHFWLYYLFWYAPFIILYHFLRLFIDWGIPINHILYIPVLGKDILPLLTAKISFQAWQRAWFSLRKCKSSNDDRKAKKLLKCCIVNSCLAYWLAERTLKRIFHLQSSRSLGFATSRSSFCLIHFPSIWFVTHWKMLTELGSKIVKIHERLFLTKFIFSMCLLSIVTVAALVN